MSMLRNSTAQSNTYPHSASLQHSALESIEKLNRMPFHDVHDLPEFKDWLVKTIEPLCDADPIVMADYIIALLQHDAVMSETDWIDFISKELSDFLEDKSRPFVELLFQTIHSKGFLPASSAPPAATSVQAPVPVSSYTPSDSAPHIAPAGPQTDGPVAGPSRSAGEQAENGGDIDMAGGSQPRRKKCFDYHEKGYCMRGASCPYEHSNDALIPTPDMMFGQMPFMPGQPMRGGQRGRGRGRGRGGHPQDGHHQAGPGGFPGQPGMPFPPPPGFFPFMPPMPMSFGQFLENDPRRDFQGSSRPPQEKSNTLVITDIPVQHLSVPGIREYFSQFGGVTNVALEARSKRALVSFESNREAYKAWKSDEAVFGSRHVKVLWHRPRPGQGGAGQKALEASAGLIANMNKMESGEGSGQSQAAKLSGPESRLRDTLAELEAKEKRSKKETLIAEQKVLLNKAKSADKEEKVRILGRLRTITKEMADLDKPNPSTPAQADVEMSDKDKLDAELEKHGMETAKGKDEAELLQLHAQLAALKDKASTLGIAASPGSARYSPYPSARGSRGRGRARGRGRGGFAAARPMSLDNRSKVIAVSGDVVASDQGKASLREWYENNGGSVDNAALAEGKMLVTYPSREMAERALAQGTRDIPNIAGGVSATWHTPEQVHVQATSTEVEMGDELGRRGERDEEE